MPDLPGSNDGMQHPHKNLYIHRILRTKVNLRLHHQKRNEPMYLPVVVETLASIRGETVKQLADATTANAIEFFRLPVSTTIE